MGYYYYYYLLDRSRFSPNVLMREKYNSLLLCYAGRNLVGFCLPPTPPKDDRKTRIYNLLKSFLKTSTALAASSYGGCGGGDDEATAEIKFCRTIS